MKWELMHFAPKDRRVLAVLKNERIRTVRWDSHRGAWRADQSTFLRVSPQYWMPLPLTPYDANSLTDIWPEPEKQTAPESAACPEVRGTTPAPVG